MLLLKPGSQSSAGEGSLPDPLARTPPPPAPGQGSGCPWCLCCWDWDGARSPQHPRVSELGSRPQGGGACTPFPAHPPLRRGLPRPRGRGPLRAPNRWDSSALSGHKGFKHPVPVQGDLRQHLIMGRRGWGGGQRGQPPPLDRVCGSSPNLKPCSLPPALRPPALHASPGGNFCGVPDSSTCLLLDYPRESKKPGMKTTQQSCGWGHAGPSTQHRPGIARPAVGHRWTEPPPRAHHHRGMPMGRAPVGCHPGVSRAEPRHGSGMVPALRSKPQAVPCHAVPCRGSGLGLTPRHLQGPCAGPRPDPVRGSSSRCHPGDKPGSPGSAAPA